MKGAWGLHDEDVHRYKVLKAGLPPFVYMRLEMCAGVDKQTADTLVGEAIRFVRMAYLISMGEPLDRAVKMAEDWRKAEE